MTAKFEAFSFAGFLTFIASGPLIGATASGNFGPRWLIAPFALTGIAGFWIWMNWILRRARAN